jgi:hypothetical protein
MGHTPAEAVDREVTTCSIVPPIPACADSGLTLIPV